LRPARIGRLDAIPNRIQRGQEQEDERGSRGGPADQRVGEGSPEHRLRQGDKRQHRGERRQDNGTRALDGCLDDRMIGIRLTAVSAALKPGEAAGCHVVATVRRAARRDGKVIVHFGRLPDAEGWCVADSGSPSAEILTQVRHIGDLAHSALPS
jgi:hypothetical protein